MQGWSTYTYRERHESVTDGFKYSHKAIRHVCVICKTGIFTMSNLNTYTRAFRSACFTTERHQKKEKKKPSRLENWDAGVHNWKLVTGQVSFVSVTLSTGDWLIGCAHASTIPWRNQPLGVFQAITHRNVQPLRPNRRSRHLDLHTCSGVITEMTLENYRAQRFL